MYPIENWISNKSIIDEGYQNTGFSSFSVVQVDAWSRAGPGTLYVAIYQKYILYQK